MDEVKEKAGESCIIEEDLGELRFDSVVKNSPDGIVVMDYEGVIQYVNRASELMFGRSKEELIGKELGYPVMSGETVEIEVLHHGRPPCVAEMRVVSIDWRGQSSLLATLRDISKRIKLTNELLRSNKELEKFASVVSHEIRAPLRNLHLLSGWLLEDHSSDLNADAMEDVELMRKTTASMQRMVEDLLHYCRAGLRHKLSSDVKLEEVLLDALDSLQEEIFSSDAQVIKDPLPTIDCNVQAMVTLFRHIISNAITYCSQKPRIMVKSSRVDGMWKISFTDNGVGVEKKYWEKIFIPFNHLQTSDTYAGSGIGLATCKKIAELHHGKIWLESDPGGGSVVHVCLPEKGQSYEFDETDT
ncbi:MAG: ATP-binding protein [Granulosicoccus sp.]